MPCKEWYHKGFSAIQKFKTELSARKILASLYWDREGLIQVNFLLHRVTVTAQYYCNVIQYIVHQAILMISPEKLKIDLLHNNDTYSKFDEGDIDNNGLSNHDCPTYTPDSATSDFYLFGPQGAPRTEILK
jgi:hypothetical protein